jgi:hypothetical protein
MYGASADSIRRALERYEPNIRIIAADEHMALYEIVRFP